jgi:hypothetical protein
MGSPNDLARLSDLKSWLGISGGEDDTLLERLISQTSRAILGYLDRPSIIPDIYLESMDGGNESSILLRHWPVTAVESCSVNGVTVPAASDNGPATFGYVVDAAETFPPGRMQRISLRGGTFPCGVQNVTIAYQAGYQIMHEPSIVPLSPPFEVFVLAPHGDFASDVGVTGSIDTQLVKVTTNPASGEYRCQNGVYVFSSADAGKAVQVSYGYVPGELARCCIEWAADQYQYRTRIGQHTKSLGGQESVSFIVKDIPDLVKTVLQPFRRVVTP